MKLYQNENVKLFIARITPQDADEMLQKVNKDCRAINWQYVTQLAATICCGKWKLSPDAIILNGDGEVVNGVTRLEALRLAGKENPELSIMAIVARGLDPNIGFDRERVRTHSQQIRSIYGLDYNKKWLAVSKFLYGYSGACTVKRGSIRDNGLDAEYNKYIVDIQKEFYEELDQLSAVKNTESSWAPYRAVLLLLLYCGEYKNSHIQHLAEVFASGSDYPEDRPIVRMKIKARTEMSRVRVTSNEDDVDEETNVKPDEDIIYKMMCEMVAEFDRYLRSMEDGDKHPKMKKEDAKDFVYRQITSIFAPLNDRKEEDRRVAKEKAKRGETQM